MLEAARCLVALALLLILVPASMGQAPPEPPALKFTVNSFQVTGENPLSPAQTDKALAPFLGEYSGIEGLLEAANTLEQTLQNRGYSFYRVVLPPQTLQKGRITLEVVAFKIGRIIIKGNKYFSDDNILRAMPSLQSGERPNPAQQSRERYLANLHPSRQIELRFKESETEQAIDAYLDVRDSRPQSLFIGYNNTGNKATGHTRVTAGYQHSNFTGHDDQLTVNFTDSPSKVSKVEQVGMNYAWPLYNLGGILSAYAASSDVDSGTVAAINVSGAGKFIGASYTQYLPRNGGYTHQWSLSIDDKRFINNSVDVTGALINPVNVRSRPLTLRYTGDYEFQNGNAGFYLSYSRNLPFGSLNNKFNYIANRPFDTSGTRGADHIWDVTRFGAHADYQLEQGWLLRWRGDGQLTDEPLISGEQFGLGGAKSVRGYEERAVSGDVGVFSSIEAWTPPLVYNIRAIGFFDTGHLRNKNVLAGAQKSDTLSSFGLGLRWFYKANFSAELDLARILTNVGIDENGATIDKRGDYKAHFNLFFRY